MHKFTVKCLFWTLCKLNIEEKNWIDEEPNKLQEIYVSCQFDSFTVKNAN